MKKIIILITFASLLLADFKIGIPKDPVSNTFNNLILTLTEKNIIKKNHIKIIEVDMKQSNISKMKKEIEETDLFFITGSYFNLYFTKINPNVNTLVMGNKKSSDIKKFNKDRLLGIYRTSAMGNIKDLLLEIDKNNLTTGIITRKNSVFSKSRVKNLIKLAKKHDINMIELPYSNKKDLKEIFEKNKDKLNSIQLWPASVNLKDMKYINELQHIYKIPLIAQRMVQVKKGAAIGYLLDYDKALDNFAIYIDKLSSGIPINELKSQEGKHIHVINLNSVSKLELQLSEKLIKNSKIITKIKDTQIYKPLVKGSYTVAIPDFKHVLYSNYLEALKKIGYVENKNLKVIRVDMEKKKQELPEDTNMIFTMGNFLTNFLEIRKDIPMSLFSIYDFNDVFDKENTFHLEVNENDIVEKIKNSFPRIKNIITIGDKNSKMPFLDKKMTGILAQQGHSVSSHLYDDINEIENIFKKMDRNKDMILLFPASVQTKDLKKLISLQNKYKVTVVSQSINEVKAGVAFGITTDIDFIVNTLADTSHNVFQGIEIKDCICPPIDLKFYINLKSIRNINYKLNKSILLKAEVIK